MQILFSKYNLPFCEASTPEAHYISLDDQRDIRAGVFDAHVRAFAAQLPSPRLSLSRRTFRADDFLEVFDPLTGITVVHDMRGDSGLFIRSAPKPAVASAPVDKKFVDQLRASKVKAADRIYQCTCGNSRRPWRCTCHK